MRLLAYLVIVYLSCIGLFAQEKTFLKNKQNLTSTMIIAHRGANAYAPENTMPAFSKAVELGADMFELDVHVSKDGIVVVFHDDSLVKCTNVEEVFPDRSPYYVSNFTYEELQKLDAGSWFIEKMNATSYLPGEEKYITKEEVELYSSGQVKIPSLEEVLLYVKEQPCYANIEIKSISQYYPDIAKQVVSLVEKTNVASKVVISSFDHYAIYECKKINDKIATAALCGERIFSIGDYCDTIFADAANVNMKIIGFDSIPFRQNGQLPIQNLLEAQKKGIAINVWTVNDPTQIELLVIAGVNGIISDYPNRVKEALQKVVEHQTPMVSPQNNSK